MREDHAIKAVIFDVGGVLLRTEDRAPREKMAEKLGLTYTKS
jgi:FMN phosphatase YigB (HAD superfamily)